MRLIFRDSYGRDEKEITKDEAFCMLRETYGDDAKFHLDELLSDTGLTSSVKNGGIFRNLMKSTHNTDLSGRPKADGPIY